MCNHYALCCITVDRTSTHSLEVINTMYVINLSNITVRLCIKITSCVEVNVHELGFSHALAFCLLHYLGGIMECSVEVIM